MVKICTKSERERKIGCFRDTVFRLAFHKTTKFDSLVQRHLRNNELNQMLKFVCTKNDTMRKGENNTLILQLNDDFKTLFQRVV